jgi:hypothetical protein
MNKSGGSAAKSRSAVLPMFLLSIACAFGMFGLGFAVNLAFTRWMPDLALYPAFGMELSLGFAGGHGTAGLMGNVLQKLNMPYQIHLLSGRHFHCGCHCQFAGGSSAAIRPSHDHHVRIGVYIGLFGVDGVGTAHLYGLPF